MYCRGERAQGSLNYFVSATIFVFGMIVANGNLSQLERSVNLDQPAQGRSHTHYIIDRGGGGYNISLIMLNYIHTLRMQIFLRLILHFMD